MTEHNELSDAVSKASEHVRERKAASEEAAERAKPKSSGPRLALAMVVLAAVVAWDAYVLTRPPEGLPPAEQEVDLGWLVVDAVELIESYREDEGRLPTAVELRDLLDEAVSYRAQGGRYFLVVQSDDVRVEYDDSVSIDEWLAARGLNEGGGNGS